jgi:sec-independent protein translocase protein TatA
MHWLVVAILVLIVFGGRGKISSLMGDFASGIKAFKKGMAEDDTPAKPVEPVEPVRTIDHQSAAPTATAATTNHKAG